MDTDLNLSQLLAAKDHLNVLRYIRIHELREPATVVASGKLLLGPDLQGGKSTLDVVVRLAALEQICTAAVDLADTSTADVCLTRLVEAGVTKESTRFRLLLARCLEGSSSSNSSNKNDNNNASKAELIYTQLLKENPANNLALKRKYCLLKSIPGKQVEAAEALNAYLQQNYSDTAAWYELAQLRQELGDWKSASYCLEEVVLATPASAIIHCELAEAYATVGGGLDMLLLARRHMAQALELEPTLVRAQMGLVVVSNAYLQEAAAKNIKNVDEFEVEVAQELLKFGVERVLASYKGSPMLDTVRTLMSEYKEGL